MTHLVPTVLASALGAFELDTRGVDQALYLIPLIPMVGALILGLIGKRLSHGNVALIGCGTIAASFGLSLLVVLDVVPMRGSGVVYQDVYQWFHAGELNVELAYGVDRLSGTLLLIITGVGFLIHVYSISYMHEDPGFSRFFCYLNLFVGMMLILVMGANLVVMFVGWEGVGLASYLLIGFWYEDDAKAFAGRKAFIANRVGDFGFLLGIFTLFSLFGTINFFSPNAEDTLLSRVEAAAEHAPAYDAQHDILPLEQVGPGSGVFGPSQAAVGAPDGVARLGWSYYAAITLACLLLFLGACGKSAQIPLYVWLPDAMAGPTPVSALIHAATMVTAGVYLLCRLSFLYAQSPTAMLVVAAIGAATALFAAIIGTAQDDIKKVLAYSTVSQLGYMVLGAGVGGYWASSLHLLTHAFFKACLFLGAGAVMHGMMNETNIWKLGGLRKTMPWTAYTFLIATIAITGVIPVLSSGFFSKDAILDIARHSHLPGGEATGWILWGVGTIGAGFTAFYMFRAYFLTFEGEQRTMRDHHPHESWLMNVPLAVLAFGALVTIGLGVPVVHPNNTQDYFTPWAMIMKPVFEPALRTLESRLPGPEVEAVPWSGWIIATLVAWGGAAIAYLKYYAKPVSATDLAAERPLGNALVEAVRHKFYIDEIYDFVIIQNVKRAAYYLWKFVDELVIDTLFVRGAAFVTELFADLFRGLENGRVASYAAVMAVGLASLLFISPLLSGLHALLFRLGF